MQSPYDSQSHLYHKEMVHPRWTDISTSVMLGADLDAPSPSPALAFSGDADMVNENQRRCREGVEVGDGPGVKLISSEPRL